ncbi:MAG: hypothetical protein ACQCN6_02765 [Candidatus Bathyarchaeia archaeon]|jgi:hypothetical protein
MGVGRQSNGDYPFAASLELLEEVASTSQQPNAFAELKTQTSAKSLRSCCARATLSFF